MQTKKSKHIMFEKILNIDDKKPLFDFTLISNLIAYKKSNNEIVFCNKTGNEQFNISLREKEKIK